jgi:aldehyde:ferredoxin oxidoreductase
MMAKTAGWNGRLLELDLSNRSWRKESISTSRLTFFLGGRGLNGWILAPLLSSDVDPFDARNPLVFAAGPLTGTRIPANGRYNVSSRSPLTGLFGDSNAAGIWAVALKKAGLDAIKVVGSSDLPVYVYLDSEQVMIREAGPLWGKTTTETDRQLKAEYGQDAQILSIGPAGENLVRYACLMNDVDRAAGRTGMGAVMGAKKLKAIVIRASGEIPVANAAGLKQIAREIRQAMMNSPSYEVRSTYGTPFLTNLYNRMGVLPTKNSQIAQFEAAELISGERLRQQFVDKPRSCYACPVHCSRISSVKEGRFKGLEFEGPEFETICSLGSKLGHSDLEAILYISKRLNDLGLDSISTGGVIAFSMECYEKGLMTREQADGLELEWGNTEAILSVVEKIALRQGIGDLLAEGVRRVSQEIPGSEHYALHVKGMEVPTQDVRGLKAWGLGWAVSSRGADHCRAFPVMETTWAPEQAEQFFGSKEAANRFSYEGKAAMVKWAEDFGAVIDALGLCTISYIAMGLSPELVSWAYTAVTGKKMKASELFRIGERITNQERLINLKLGLQPTQDTLPERFVQEPVPDGPTKGEVIDIQRLITDYYRLRGWDSHTGRPSRAKLRELDLR